LRRVPKKWARKFWETWYRPQWRSPATFFSGKSAKEALKERGLAGTKRTISDIVRQSPTVGDSQHRYCAETSQSVRVEEEEKEKSSRKTEKKRHIRMMAFVSDFSCECVKTELDIFAVPPTQTSIQQAEWVEYYYYIIRTLGTTTDKTDKRTDRHTENKHKTTHYR